MENIVRNGLGLAQGGFAERRETVNGQGILALRLYRVQGVRFQVCEQCRDGQPGLNREVFGRRPGDLTDWSGGAVERWRTERQCGEGGGDLIAALRIGHFLEGEKSLDQAAGQKSG